MDVLENVKIGEDKKVFENISTDGRYRLYGYLGVHRAPCDNENGYSYTFRMYDPLYSGEKEVFLVGDFAGWEKGVPMERTEGGVLECIFRSHECLEGMLYKYRVLTDNKVEYRKDSFALLQEERGGMASVICTDTDFRWNDTAWLRNRAEMREKGIYSFPLNALYLGPVTDLKSMANSILPYTKRTGYTHVCIKSPFGKIHPQEIKYFVNKLHTNGVGVIAELDLSNIRSYDEYEKNAVISLALLAADEYHTDGIMLSSMPFMIGEENKKPCCDRERIHDSIDFVRELTSVIKKEAGEVFTVANECTGTDLFVTSSVLDGGLGFDFEMISSFSGGYASYLSTDPYFRKDVHSHILSPFTLSEKEHFMLCKRECSCDNVFGDSRQKIAQIRLSFLYEMLLPCAHMSRRGKDTDALTSDEDKVMGRFTASLGELYLKHPAIYKGISEKSGFEILISDESRNVLAVRRYADDDSIIAIFNFSGTEQDGIELPSLYAGYEEIFSTGILSGAEKARILKSGGLNKKIPALGAFVLARTENQNEL